MSKESAVKKVMDFSTLPSTSLPEETCAGQQRLGTKNGRTKRVLGKD